MDKQDTSALAILKKFFGYQDFRPLQGEIVKAISEGEDSLVWREVHLFSGTRPDETRIMFSG